MEFSEIPVGDEQVFTNPRPEIVVVIKSGCVINAFSMNGNSDMAYAVIDLDNQESDGEHLIPPMPEIYVVDGVASSLDSLILTINN